MSEPAWDVDHERRQPLFAVPPLRVPGQSTDERIVVYQNKIGELFVVPLLLVAVSALGWVQWCTERPLNPLIFTLLALIAMLHAGKRIRAYQATITNLRFGRDGERLVGQLLELLRAKGYRVFHDIPGSSFNIDHVIVGPAGIFTIETKARTKPTRGRSRIVYDGKTVRIEGQPAVDAPLVQARAQARWLADTLNRDRHATYKVRPILVFPEWYVERTGGPGHDDVWVLNPKALEKFLECEPPRLCTEEADSAAQLIGMYCRQALRRPA